MHAITNFVIGQRLRCKYPQHGTRNILCNRDGQIIKAGVTKNGLYATIKSADGTYRSLSVNRMIDAKVS
jgi:hypothetical protein